jgi:hypothetical protein
VAERQLLRAARQFLEQTRAWRVNIALSVTAATPTVDISALLPTESELVDVISMKNSGGGAPVVPRTYSWLDENTSDWRSEENDLANYFVREDNSVLRLVPTPATTTANLYDTRIAVKPTLSATTIDDRVANKYDEVIIHGALGYLYMLPKKTWTDPQLGQFHMAMFANAIPEARVEAAEEFQTGVPRKVKYGGL